MRRVCVFLPVLTLIILSQLNRPTFATALATVRGIVHDPSHRPLENAEVVIQSRTSNWSATTRSNSEGEFQFEAVPPGDYTLKVTAEGFSPAEQFITAITAAEGKSAVIHVPLEVAPTRQVVEVLGRESRLQTQSSTVQTMVSSQEVARTPGADQTNSLAMITDFTPGATMVHDMLHMREGHQVNWFFDGIPVINTSIAANVAPLINPKNVESLRPP